MSAYSLILKVCTIPVVLMLVSCGGKDGAGEKDEIAPAEVIDLSVDLIDYASAVLSWTAPGDDGNDGTATEYDVRYGETEITAANFSSATKATGLPAPGAAGTSETFTFAGLAENSTYYFALMTADEVPNWSGLSNIASITAPPQFVFEFGSPGTDNGDFNNPVAIAVNSVGAVYVADAGNDRIQAFDRDGTFLTKWGSRGTEDGQFMFPADVATDSSGHVYVADAGNYRIQKFDGTTGAFLSKWGSAGTGDGQFDELSGVATDSNDNVYAADSARHDIQRFDAAGTFVTKWSSSGPAFDLAIDTSFNIYVGSNWYPRINKYDDMGGFITVWGSPGSGAGEFFDPAGIAVDRKGYVYVADTGHNRIQKFDAMGVFITEWGSEGTGDGQFDSPVGVAADHYGNIYVVDQRNNRIQCFR